MARSIKDSFLDLERHRQLLEDNIEKLKKSLQHWQTWEAEYEGLKEEILAVQPAATPSQLVRIGLEYGGTLVDRKEVEDILGLKAGTTRSAQQVTSLLSRRIDYVQQNVRTVQKQLDTAENKLAAATVISNPEVRNEEGLPVTEIIEELDEDGNEISSRVQTPGGSQSQLLEVLKKAGVKDLPDGKPKNENAEQKVRGPSPLSRETQIKPEERITEVADDEPAQENEPVKKGVTFAEDTKAGPEPKKSKTAKRVEEIMNIAKAQNEPITDPVIPVDDSPEDAALRREMLQYGMSDIGNIVAELKLEEGAFTDDDEDYDDESEDEEDEFGRSVNRVMDDEEMKQQMREIEERLGLRMMENVGPGGDVEDGQDEDYGIVKEGIGRISINQASTPSNDDDVPEPKSALKKETAAGKKAVKFAEELDISPAPEPPAAPQTAKVKSAPVIAPVADIVERKAPESTSALESAAAPIPAKKQSRFKSSRTAATPSPNPTTSPSVTNGPLASSSTRTGPSLPLFPAKPTAPKPFSQPITFTERTRTVPTGPENQVLSSNIVERDVEPDPNMPEPDEFDPALLNQEVATEYHKMRNRMIQRQGGFLKNDEDESGIVPLDEDEGGPKKLSRFKAARLARG